MKPFNYQYLGLCILLLLYTACKKEEQFRYPGHEAVLEKLLQQEDTDGDKKITTDDKGLKKFEFKDYQGKSHQIEGTYHLSNLLQELAITKEDNIAIDKVTELPSDRISRLIKTRYWDNLTRSIDKNGLSKVLEDEKSETDTFRIYIPSIDYSAIEYFQSLQVEMPALKVVTLPEKITPGYVKTLNDKPGILNLAHTKDTNGNYIAKPFVVPGGRFNEMYGWDSYFESVGLLIDDREDLAMAMADNFGYQIEHYGKILNANRSYYLTRTQPPFFSSLLRDIYRHNPKVSKAWISENLKKVIKAYHSVWMKKNIRLTNTGLNRYYGEGLGRPPETEKGHFDVILQKYAAKHDLDLNAFKEKYIKEQIKDTELDAYFTHDRSMRESGHDTSNRLDATATDLNTVGLNSLLYKYETDIAYLIKTLFDDRFTIDDTTYTSEYWLEKAEARKQKINTLMWNEEQGSFFDYNFKTKSQAPIIAATNIYPMWAKLCTKDQAATLVKTLFESLVQKGGIAGTSDLLDPTNPDAVQRQWDYPYGWAPHQMMIWQGLLNYGYKQEAQELIYRWLWMITKNAVNYNGTIPEKYDVVNCTHKVYAEYGNVGTDFDYITPSGFGWMNASYQLGLSFLNEDYKAKLNQLIDPDAIFDHQTK